MILQVVRKPLSSGRYVSSPKNSQVKEIDLIPIPVRSLNHTKSLDRKSESLAGDCETEIFPLKGVHGFIEEELVESSEPSNVNERSEAQNIVDLTVWECLVTVDFW
jgi:hypothetical protein